MHLHAPQRPLWQGRLLRRTFRYLLKLRGSADKVALGISIGVFVAFTPTIGFQWLCALVLATLFRVSRPAALLPILITNPVTIPPTFYIAYRVGLLFWSGPPAMDIYNALVRLMKGVGMLNFYQAYIRLREFFGLGMDAMVPLWIGGVLLGLLSALITYPISRRLVQRFHDFQARRREHKIARRDKRRHATAPHAKHARASKTQKEPPHE